MIVIVDYGMGNLGSIANMLKKVGAEAVISSEAAIIEKGDKLILPGVGAFDNGIKNLTELGLLPLLNNRVLREKVPILGLCLGMQLFTRRSEEGQLPGLGWLEAETVRFRFDRTPSSLKIPHMGWNVAQVCQPNSLFSEIDEAPRFYFVHSYYVVCMESRMVLTQTKYGYTFTSAIVKENIAGVQFHPEKSHRFGMKLLKNFVERF